jgi:MraZ protein
MALFSGTHYQNFDSKGRVSVPASFRNALRESSSIAAAAPGPISIPLVLRPSNQARCIDGWTENRFSDLQAELDKLDPLSVEREALATVVFGDAHVMETDKEGRIIIDADLLSFAGIARGGQIAFLGLGTQFQIWDPDAVAEWKAAAQAINNERVASHRRAAQ